MIGNLPDESQIRLVMAAYSRHCMATKAWLSQVLNCCLRLPTTDTGSYEVENNFKIPYSSEKFVPYVPDRSLSKPLDYSIKLRTNLRLKAAKILGVVDTRSG